MREGWEIKNFEECIIKIENKNKVQTKLFYESGKYPIISQEKEFINGFWNNEEDLFRIKKPIIIFGDHTKVLKYVDFDFVLGADGIKLLEPIDEIIPKYFYYYLSHLKLANLGYSRHYRLLKEVQIIIPPLTEQQKIVSILDEAFTAIDKAKENAEKNLKNAKELFENYLESVFSNPEEDWEVKRLGEIITLEYGKPLPKEARNNDYKYPVYGANGEKSRTDSYYCSKKSIIIGRKGSAGEVRLTEEKYWPLDVTFFVEYNEQKTNLVFLYYLLKNLKLQNLAKGVKPGINRHDVYEILIKFPELQVQAKIVDILNQLIKKVDLLQNNYLSKLKSLEELKQSILNKALSGELTSVKQLEEVS